MLYIHSHLINAVGSQKVSCLCLVDLSAAFHTIDHNTLIARLSSWFGIHGSILCWIMSYLSSCFVCVNCDNNHSSLHTFSSGVPQGSILGSLLFITYTTLSKPYYSYLFPFPWPPHFCRWHSTLLLFPSLNFDSSISHFQNVRQQISSWMTANLLDLNSSATEFLLQHAKIRNSSLDTSHSAWNLGFTFDTNILSSLTSLHLSSEPVTVTFVNFAASGHTSLWQLATSLQTWLLQFSLLYTHLFLHPSLIPLWFTTRLIHNYVSLSLLA